jgi:hypothetical protein
MSCLTERDLDDASSAETGTQGAQSSDGDTGAARSCSPNPVPTCGDASVDALEECEDGASCDACVSTAVETTLVGHHGLFPLVFATDGSSFAHIELDAGERYLRRYSAEGTELWSAMPGVDELVAAAALDAAGNAYVAGIEGLSPTRPWLSSWDAGGALRWTATDADSGSFHACATDDSRLVAVGRRGDGDIDAGLLQVRGLDGTESWTMIEPSVRWMSGVAIVGAEIAVTAVGIESTSEIDDTKLMRYAEDGVLRWSLTLPQDGEQSQRRHGIIADGMTGTWTFGEAELGPYAVHHDGDGDELEVLDCIGGGTGWVHAAALDAEHRLALAIEVRPDSPYDESHAWFPTIEAGVVVRAAAFSNESENSAGPLAVQWRDDGALLVGWGRSGEEGGIYSELVALSP